jgi:2-methylisocitrate lyase-like PEP mutase family enzyme
MPSSGEALHDIAYAANRLEASGIVVADQWIEGTAAEGSIDAVAARISALRGRTVEGDPGRLVIVRLGGYTAARASRDTPADVIRRARLFAETGADVAFVPEADTRDIVRLVRDIPIPVAVDIGDGWGPAVHWLARAGVRCVVLGAAPMHAAIAATHTVAREAFQHGTYDAWRRARSGSDVESVLPISP